ncbi:hypothetical protein ABT072_45780, partial [Streptomyces sp. NPDC002589]|uniref:hypothetical protein n=1 Tax=Streptomyces sp. NPDC002589 TaxID=3154420 RepID=UPI003330E01B
CPLLVRKIPSPHIKIITAQDEEQSRLSKHDLVGSGGAVGGDRGGQHRGRDVQGGGVVAG